MNTRIDLPDDLAARVIRFAARRAPAELAGRLEEEWLAGLAERAGPVARLRLALGCCWAQQSISRDPLWATARSAAPAVHAVAGGWVLQGPSRPTRRVAVLVAIASLHLGAVGAFIYGVTQVKPAARPTTTTVDFFDPVRPHETPLPAPHPDVGRQTQVPPLGEVPVGRIVVDDNTFPPGGVDGGTGPMVPAHAVHAVRGGPGAGFPDTQDYYPAAAIRLEEQGVASVRVCVDERGRLTGEPVVQGSSGYPRLDGGALALARAGSGHYRSNAEDGRAVPGCFAFAVRFALRR